VAASFTLGSSSSATGVVPTSSSSTTVGSSVPVDGVAVFPGESIQAAVDAYPVGTTFVIKAGVHRRQSVMPKDGDVFVGESGAVLSGEGVTEFAFGGKGAEGVTIRGLVIEKYASELQAGVVRNVSGSYDWLIEGNEIRFNQGIGVKSASGWRIVGNYIHHNEQLGLGGAGSNMVIDGNEIAFNNAEKTVNPFWGGGGAKWVHSTGLVVRNNYVHDNYGPGLWTDGYNVNTLYEGNIVVGNWHAGIKHEVSCDAVIRNNTVEGNGFGNDGWVAGAGILIANSPDVQVYGNTVRYNNDGIGGVHADRTVSDSPCPVVLKNLSVHDNVIAMNVGQTGVVTNTSDPVFSDQWNNRFDHNTYVLGSGDQYYRWAGATVTTDQWKAYGQDPHSIWK
jgi:parallel beta-helix repeat protein